jgi:hypothetical protein
MTHRTGGRILVDQLVIQGCDRIFTVRARASCRHKKDPGPKPGTCVKREAAR